MPRAKKRGRYNKGREQERGEGRRSKVENLRSRSPPARRRRATEQHGGHLSRLSDDQTSSLIDTVRT